YILYGWIGTLLLLFTGCIKDEVKDCDEDTCIRFNFVYDFNADEEDLFAQQVDHISLFIYNTDTGILEDELEVYRTDMEANHTVSLMLPAGRHTAVAWGNCHTEHYRIYDTETTASMQMEMTCIDGYTMTRANPGTLFHASNTFEVVQGSEYTVPMSLIKNSNTVKVIIKGLTKEDQEMAESIFVFRLVSNNWKYNYDNSVCSEYPLTYIPEYNPEYEDEDGYAISATFYPLRLFTYDEESVLTVRYRNPVTGREASLEAPLIPYLLKQFEEEEGIIPGTIPVGRADNELLDRHDTYQVIFVLEINADGDITFEEWNRINQDQEL
ncbi:MAG: FimB/Mfa2 family fimbrial subunit, partial [Tannerellaceae bacterium]|nr:FimB/Mfa2 family fimbrial subunit [Tannerellaceae bacterium]